MTVPRSSPCQPWPLDTSCCAGWADLPEQVRGYATGAAERLLWALSGRRLGLCEVVVRPCRRRCTDQVIAGSLWWRLAGGWWLASCGCPAGTRCGCDAARLALPGPVHQVSAVRVDGTELPETAYRVDAGRWLVRQDGHPWPHCQDLNTPADSVGTFEVRYQRGRPVRPDAAAAAGVYACEVAKACTGDRDCRLPQRVASIARQGIDVEFLDPTVLANKGLTGIPEVDSWLRAVNPDQLPTPARVWSPDGDPNRVSTP
jgi:hypothetical protein